SGRDRLPGSHLPGMNSSCRPPVKPDRTWPRLPAVLPRGRPLARYRLPPPATGLDGLVQYHPSRERAAHTAGQPWHELSKHKRTQQKPRPRSVPLLPLQAEVLAAAGTADAALERLIPLLLGHGGRGFFLGLFVLG